MSPTLHDKKNLNKIRKPRKKGNNSIDMYVEIHKNFLHPHLNRKKSLQTHEFNKNPFSSFI